MRRPSDHGGSDRRKRNFIRADQYVGQLPAGSPLRLAIARADCQVFVALGPDGRQIPLGALPGKEPGHYLIEQRSIAVVPVPRVLGSAGVALAQSGGSRTGAAKLPPSLLLAGDINYGGEAGTGGERAAMRSAAMDRMCAISH
jgi:hypothetical protein